MVKSNYPKTIILKKNGEEIKGTRNSGSVIDPVGFVVNTDDEVYRLITPYWVEPIKKLLALPNIEDIFDIGLIRTELTDITVSSAYPLVIKHEKLPFQSLHHEWAPNMIKEAGQVICKLGKILYEAGYTYKDGNLSNLSFIHSKPTFFDLGSIIPIETVPNSPNGFPLEFSGAFMQQTGTMMERNTENITNQGILNLREQYMNDAIGFFDVIDEYFEGTEYKVPVTEWAGYGGKFFNYEALNPKQQSVYTALTTLYNEHGMRTLVDIGGSKGAFSEPAADLGYTCVAFDLDTKSVMSLYERVKRENRTITPLRMDFLEMTPQISGFAPATERFKSDVSLFLALVHHLSLGQRISFDDITSRLDLLTKKYCIVEFIPKTDYHVGARGGWGNPDWYTIENFTKAMEHKGFVLKENLPSAPDPRRILVYGRNNV